MTTKSSSHRAFRLSHAWLALCLMLALVPGLALPAAAKSDAEQAAPAAGQFTLFLPLVAQGAGNGSPDGLWNDVDEASLAPFQSQRRIIPQAYRTMALSTPAVRQTLAAAPLEGAAGAARAPARISLPLPDGRYQWFTLYESPIMEPALAAKFPEITTYGGQGIDDPAATIRLDWTPRGFHGLILSPNGTVYIDPYSKADTRHYISYYAADFAPDAADLLPRLDDVVESQAASQPPAPRPLVASGSQLRTYRLAVAATGEYTVFHDGTVPLALAAINTTVNRVNGIYEREVAVRLVLVANNDQIIYTDENTDPYGTADDLSANQANIDDVIGGDNYDIGHLFKASGGGVAELGCVCNNALKARGLTGRGRPEGDPFDVDYVAHEIGHQFGANHTWNGTLGSCTTDQFNSGTAFEPGSGSTIMSYAGICHSDDPSDDASDDLQPNSDAYFHSVSIDEIVAFTTTGGGNACPNTTASGNGIPTANAGADHTIPANTPFTLTGSGGDPNGDALTYAWEEFDGGARGAPNNPNSPPYFRSFTPTTSPARTFPRIQDLVNNTTTTGEILPNAGGALTFRLTVRDNRAGGGGVNHDTAQVNVVATAGPFRVTSPDTAVNWKVGDTRTVTWNVANTTAAPVSCPNVNILLSLDGGFTYPVTLAAGVPNNGSATVTIPNDPTGQARIKVACASSIFFDISNANFTIRPSANAGGPYVTDEGVDRTLDASASSASDTYAWDFDNDGVFDDATGVNPAFNLVGQAGVYPVAVRVTKNGISDVATTTVTVNNVAPSVSFGSDSPRDEGALLTISGVVSDPGWLNSLTATVDWGDGAPVETIAGTLENVRPDATLSFSVPHVYADNGSYTVRVCGRDNNGATTCSSSSVTIENVPASVNAGQDQVVYEGDTAVLDPATFNDPGTLDTHTATIDWGDGSPLNTGVVSEAPFGPPGSTAGANGSVAGQHQYTATPGVYTVTVTVTDDDGGVGSDTLRVTVVPGFLRFCVFADNTTTSQTLIMKYASLACARVPGGAPGNTRPGGVGSRGSMEAEDHASIAGDMVSLNNEVIVKGDTVLDGSVVAKRDVELEDHARATGDVTTAGNIIVKGQSVISGDATAGGTVQLSGGSQVGGAIQQSASVPPIHRISTVQLTLSAGTQNVDVAGERALAPGNYRDLHVRTGAKLTLRSGRYALRQLVVEPGATVAFDLAAGPVLIDVTGDVELKERTRMAISSATGDAADILFRIGGQSVRLGEDGTYLGTFMGLKAQAKLGQNATLDGALYGKAVEVRERTQITGRPAVKVFAALLAE